MSESDMDFTRKCEILEALKDDPLMGLVSVEPGSEGVIFYDDPVDRVGGQPAIEIPHEDPHLVDESRQRNPETGRMESVPGVSPPPKSFEDLISEYGCVAKQRGFTYIVVDENACSKRPPRKDTSEYVEEIMEGDA